MPWWMLVTMSPFIAHFGKAASSSGLLKAGDGDIPLLRRGNRRLEFFTRFGVGISNRPQAPRARLLAHVPAAQLVPLFPFRRTTAQARRARSAGRGRRRRTQLQRLRLVHLRMRQGCMLSAGGRAKATA